VLKWEVGELGYFNFRLFVEEGQDRLNSHNSALTSDFVTHTHTFDTALVILWIGKPVEKVVAVE
jgi:hypothetical protein